MSTPDEIAAAYDARAAEYIEMLGDVSQSADVDREEIGLWADAVHGTILDAGCGPGLWTGFVHDRRGGVVGMDASERFIVHARQTRPNLDFLHGSFTDIPVPDGSLGGILAWYSLIHTPPAEMPSALAEFARVLRPEGSLLIGYFEGEPREGFAHAVAPAHYWSAASLSELLVEAGFTVTATRDRPRERGEASARPHGSLVTRRNGL